MGGVGLATVTLRRLPKGEAELMLGGCPTPAMQAAWHPEYPLADTLEVIGALDESERDRCWVWVATPGHVRRAADAGARRDRHRGAGQAIRAKGPGPQDG